MVKHLPQTDVYSILQQARVKIASLAAEVGVDGHAVLAALPSPGQLWYGASVPVITRRFRGSCSVLFHINRTISGQEWPLLRFHTFKDGGEVRTFHGLQWFAQHKEGQQMRLIRPKALIRTQVNETLERLQAQDRLARFCKAHHEFMQSKPLTTDSDWLQHRLCGEATAHLCDRIQIRQFERRILARMETATGALIGYQSIAPEVVGDQKRFLIAHGGLLNGSFVRIRAGDDSAEDDVLICEGVATALSLALVWQGEIRAALTASNLAAVRASVKGRAVLAHDMDIYKPRVGNVGLKAAHQASALDDLLLTPHFHLDDLEQQPTDFNDVLSLYGIDELYRQSRHSVRVG